MSSDFPRITLTDSIDYCMQMMSDKNIRYLPVFEEDKLCGIISINDVVKETILFSTGNNHPVKRLFAREYVILFAGTHIIKHEITH